jgi:hypothetical protein
MLNMNHTVWQPNKYGVSNMRSIHARITQNEAYLFCTPGYRLQNEKIQMMYILY